MCKTELAMARKGTMKWNFARFLRVTILLS